MSGLSASEALFAMTLGATAVLVLTGIIDVIQVLFWNRNPSYRLLVALGAVAVLLSFAALIAAEAEGRLG